MDKEEDEVEVDDEAALSTGGEGDEEDDNGAEPGWLLPGLPLGRRASRVRYWPGRCCCC